MLLRANYLAFDAPIIALMGRILGLPVPESVGILEGKRD
jgi:hypothetical protein